MKYWISVFGCAANTVDAEQVAASYIDRGWVPAGSVHDADDVIIVTCMIRQSAEDRVTGLLRNLAKEKKGGRKLRILVTGCMVGMAIRDRKGAMLAALHRKYPAVDEFVPIEKLKHKHQHVRSDLSHALVTISNGCNNFCSYCVVPFARGREVSRPLADIYKECQSLVQSGYTKITLVGQNVNSYGSDLIQADKGYHVGERKIAPVFVKHLGKLRIPTLFPYLLSMVADIQGVQSVDFISSNPWDFSDELIEVIAGHANIKRLIHLPVQSGDASVLKRMNRWYTPGEYKQLIRKIRRRVPDATFSTDIIVGFPGETKKQFEHTVSLCKEIGFMKAYISIYSDRPETYAHKSLGDTVPYEEKKRRWELLDALINKTNLKKGIYPKYE